MVPDFAAASVTAAASKSAAKLVMASGTGVTSFWDSSTALQELHSSSKINSMAIQTRDKVLYC
jgi:hypothetical protein